MLAFVAIVIVSVSGHDQVPRSPGARSSFALIAGTAFAGSILSYAQTPASSGLWPLATARLVAVVMLTSRRADLPPGDAAPGRGRAPRRCSPACSTPRRTPQSSRRFGSGPIAVASVLAALYPVGTVLLARFVLHEHVRGWQRAGIVLALIAVVLTAIP